MQVQKIHLNKYTLTTGVSYTKVFVEANGANDNSFFIPFKVLEGLLDHYLENEGQRIDTIEESTDYL